MHNIQKKILDLVSNKPLENISMRQIGILAGVDHPQKTKHHIEQLEKRGLVIYDKKQKTLKAIHPDDITESNLITLPIYGAADCGQALHYANDYIEGYLKVSRSLLKKTSDIIIIEASGDSMNKAQIHGKNVDDGDYVVVDTSKKVPEKNEYIVSIIDGMANIKKFVKDEKNHQIVLMPESTKNYPPIFIGEDEIDDLSICGKVIQVIKKPIY